MFACCQLGFAQYLEADRSIDWEVLNAARIEVYKEAVEKGASWTANQLREPFTPDNPPCTCCCHVKGSRVRH